MKINKKTITKLKNFKTLDDLLETDILPKQAKELLINTDKNKSDIDRVCSVIVDLLEKKE